MILLSLDFETTGLDRDKDRITEVGAVLWTTSFDRALACDAYLVKTEVPVAAEVERLTGVTNGMLKKFGMDSRAGLERLMKLYQQCDAVIGQNIKRFDKPFFINWCVRELGLEPEDKLYIDTRTDLPGVESKHLGYMAADAGFINPFPHNAISDCLTVLRLSSMHDIEVVAARAKQPEVVLQADVSYNTNQLAKARKYSWAPAPLKMWWKAVKQNEVAEEIEAARVAGFNAVQVDLPVEKLWYS